MTSKMKTMMGLAMALGSLTAGMGTARAAAVLDFSLTGSGGTVTYAGGVAPLVGTNIPVSGLNASGAPQNNGNYAVTGACGGFACLNFTTGNSTDGGNTFALGGTFTIVGAVTGIVGNTTLLTATSGVSATFQTGATFFFRTQGSDTKNQTLLTFFFGATTPPAWVFDGHVSGVGSTVGTGYSVPLVNSVDIANISTPEPTSVFLLGTAMLGIATAIRRRKKNQVTL